MDAVWDDLVAGHTLTELLCEFHCNVTILQKEAICPPGEGELTFCHGFEEQNREAGQVATISGGIGVV